MLEEDHSEERRDGQEQQQQVNTAGREERRDGQEQQQQVLSAGREELHKNGRVFLCRAPFALKFL